MATKVIGRYFSYKDREAVLNLPEKRQEELVGFLASVAKLDLSDERATALVKKAVFTSMGATWAAVSDAVASEQLDGAWNAALSAIERAPYVQRSEWRLSDLTTALVAAAGLILLADSEFEGKAECVRHVTEYLDSLGIRFTMGAADGITIRNQGTEGAPDKEPS